MKEKEQGKRFATDHFPEYTTPKYGEKIVSFAVHDANGKKRIAYVRDEENGYPYQGKDKKHGQ